VQLWRAELLSGVLEVDQGLKVLRADDMTGNMLGCKGRMLQRKLLNRWETNNSNQRWHVMGMNLVSITLEPPQLWAAGSIALFAAISHATFTIVRGG
jgi:hypothetical protein